MSGGERVESGDTNRRGLVGDPTPLIVAGLAAALVCLGVAPLVLPDGYSWIHDGVSESAAQGIAGAWLARLGFVLFGLAVVALALFVGWPGDVLALVIAATVPLAMSSEIWGVLQRAMFLTAALWYTREAVTAHQDRARHRTR